MSNAPLGLQKHGKQWTPVVSLKRHGTSRSLDTCPMQLFYVFPEKRSDSFVSFKHYPCKGYRHCPSFNRRGNRFPSKQKPGLCLQNGAVDSTRVGEDVVEVTWPEPHENKPRLVRSRLIALIAFAPPKKNKVCIKVFLLF